MAISPGQLTSVPAFERECFLLAPAGEEESITRKPSDLVHQFIVSPAAEELELIAVRDVELSTPGRITKRIIDHLLHARSAVADLTGRDPNVFYELAVRHAARLPVALIVDEREAEPPFDIDQMRVIRFDHTDLASANRCRQTLVEHLRAGLEGAVDSIIADVDPLVGAHRVEHRLTELLDSLKETLRANIASIQMVTQVMSEMDLAAGGGDEKRGEAAPGEATDQAVGDVLGNPSSRSTPAPCSAGPASRS